MIPIERTSRNRPNRPHMYMDRRPSLAMANHDPIVPIAPIAYWLMVMLKAYSGFNPARP